MELNSSLVWLERYSPVILPVFVVAEQVGVPLPAVPGLLVVGALAAQGRVSVLLVIASIAVVALPVDLIWHELGRRRGARLLAGLCRLTLEPDICVRRTQGLFERHGVRALLAAKFLPGLTTVMPPLAGIFGIPRGRFVLYDLSGILLWAGFWIGVGYVFSGTIDEAVRLVVAFGHRSVLVVVAGILGYIALKMARRWLFLRRLRIARITPEELKIKIDAGEDLAIIDLRSAMDVEAAPYAIPGSRWVAADTLDEHLSEIPGDRELILYCA